ncbi:hypothetical protein TRFO_07089 [Tritrichomonas foetus]|uniref:Coiled-coil domain-containing protein 153 n=1 Tax=Tritrichomonas foetus TaxID=1144522 RepID=A0A1J4JYP0_9EUKA|nr:hypothetical protein TRFO_07089 [Tritrichomonas foetus]|eukprot:OHT02652.1 hypothetical protein TRFO_07089 [Tritrichomonas foetus]
MPTAEEKRKLANEKRIKDAVVEKQLLNLSYEIGTVDVEASKEKDEAAMLIQKVEEDLGNKNEIVNQFTALHFDTQRENEARMSRLRERIAGLETQLKDAEAELAALKAEKKQVLAEKDSVIENQKREMKEMAYQFSDMLMKTLITITEDFETQTSDIGRDETSTLPQRERLKEFNLDRIRV